jgi:hypothetical protein
MATNTAHAITRAAAQKRAGVTNSLAIIGSLTPARVTARKKLGNPRGRSTSGPAQSSHRARPVSALYARLPSPPNAKTIAIITLAPSSVVLIARPRPSCCAHAPATATPSGKTTGTRKRAGDEDPPHHVG